MERSKLFRLQQDQKHKEREIAISKLQEKKEVKSQMLNKLSDKK